MNTPQSPARWPFPPAQQRPSPSGKGTRSSQSNNANKTGLTRGRMFADICLVALWGATIPGLMWLGAAGGF